MAAGRGFPKPQPPLSWFGSIRRRRSFESNLDVLHLRGHEKPVNNELRVVRLSVSSGCHGDKIGMIACATLFPVGGNFLACLPLEVVAWGYMLKLEMCLASVVSRRHGRRWRTSTRSNNLTTPTRAVKRHEQQRLLCLKCSRIRFFSRFRVYTPCNFDFSILIGWEVWMTFSVATDPLCWVSDRTLSEVWVDFGAWPPYI